MPQSLSQIYVHIIFSTFQRRPILNNPDLREQTWAYISGILCKRESTAIRVGGAEDHVHVLCTLPRTQCISDLIKEAKRSSTLWLKGRDAGLTDFHWQNGYGAFSVSQSHVARVRQYIENQEAHYREATFQEEFREFLRKYEIEWDERYVWD